MSSSSGDPASNGQRAAAVQRLKTAVADRKRAREVREAGKRAAGAEDQAAGSPDSNGASVPVRNKSRT